VFICLFVIIEVILIIIIDNQIRCLLGEWLLFKKDEILYQSSIEKDENGKKNNNLRVTEWTMFFGRTMFSGVKPILDL
jgi:hypothetical protein